MGSCIQCARPGGLAVDGGAVCLSCVRDYLGGAVPERITDNGLGAVYWFWCVCGLQVRRGPYHVDLARVAAELAWDEKRRDRELDRIEDYRAKVEGVPSAGVMLCWKCAAGAGDPLLAPAHPRTERGLVLMIGGRNG